MTIKNTELYHTTKLILFIFILFITGLAYVYYPDMTQDEVRSSFLVPLILSFFGVMCSFIEINLKMKLFREEINKAKGGLKVYKKDDESEAWKVWSKKSAYETALEILEKTKEQSNPTTKSTTDHFFDDISPYEEFYIEFGVGIVLARMEKDGVIKINKKTDAITILNEDFEWSN